MKKDESVFDDYDENWFLGNRFINYIQGIEVLKKLEVC